MSRYISVFVCKRSELVTSGASGGMNLLENCTYAAVCLFRFNSAPSIVHLYVLPIL